MKLAIFGASGRAGKHLVEQALQQGHSVTALVRDPARMGTRHEGLKVVQGDIGEAAKVAEVVTGAEAVLSVLGPTGNNPAFAVSQGMDNILAAMKASGVKRLIISAGAGVRDPQDGPTLMHAFFGAMVKLLSKNVYDDMVRVVEKVRASGLEWTIVRVPRLTDAPQTGKVWSGYVGKELGSRITRADMTEYMLKQLTDRSQVHLAPAISNS